MRDQLFARSIPSTISFASGSFNASIFPFKQTTIIQLEGLKKIFELTLNPWDTLLIGSPCYSNSLDFVSDVFSFLTNEQTKINVDIFSFSFEALTPI